MGSAMRLGLSVDNANAVIVPALHGHPSRSSMRAQDSNLKLDENQMQTI
jgi:hypothetical protein